MNIELKHVKKKSRRGKEKKKGKLKVFGTIGVKKRKGEIFKIDDKSHSAPLLPRKILFWLNLIKRVSII